MNDQVKASCYKCERRSISCHAGCDEYLSFRKRLAEINKMKAKEKFARNVIAQSVMDSKKRKR